MNSIRGSASLLTPSETAYTLGIGEETLNALVRNGVIPHTYTDDKLLRFDPLRIDGWLQTKPKINYASGNAFVDNLKQRFSSMYPEIIDTLKSVDTQFAPQRQRKGYSLAKIKNKKYGFLYYVRYIENGKLVPSRWNTHTNNIVDAARFAQDNRERILTEYKNRKASKDALYSILKNYYSTGSKYLENDKQRGRHLCEKNRRKYHSFLNNYLIPFLRQRGIQRLSDLAPPTIVAIQDDLLERDNSPQTINSKLSGLSAVFDYLVSHGHITENVFKRASSLKANPAKVKARGCHEIDKIYGAFNDTWEDERRRLLCAVIYSTGMRNNEIEKIRPKDIITIKNYSFINVVESKTENGVRIVPLHNFIHAKLKAYIEKQNKKENDRVFGKVSASDYAAANTALGGRVGYSPAALKELNITFYSGRHYWKTLMNANDLGDVEEYFMGHKVSKSVAERYNHRDRQGRELLVKKARSVLKILDKTLFKGCAADRS
jgi:site-specific recombinase XerD